ncbi:hypothetical protein PFISCL1PPCAC_21269, partial [Pristionchus fissidentatus]
ITRPSAASHNNNTNSINLPPQWQRYQRYAVYTHFLRIYQQIIIQPMLGAVMFPAEMLGTLGQFVSLGAISSEDYDIDSRIAAPAGRLIIPIAPDSRVEICFLFIFTLIGHKNFPWELLRVIDVGVDRAKFVRTQFG